MRHYEIVFLVHPDQSESVPPLVEKYKALVTAGKGIVHRVEDWGRRQLAYKINRLSKAHYVLMNVECSEAVRQELVQSFSINDNILRNLIVRMDEAVKGPSIMMQQETGKSSRFGGRGGDRGSYRDKREET